MGLNAKNAAGSARNYEPMAPGTYPARLVQVIDLGLQPQRPYQGQEKAPVQEIMLTYEFVDEFMKGEDGEDDPEKPRHLSESFPLYNLESEKAKSTVRYKALDPSVDRGGNWPDLIGTPCHVTIVHNPGKGKNAGRIYENIASVAAMRDKDAKRCPPLVNEARVFDLDDPDISIFLSLPKFMQEKIKGNLNYEGSKLQALLADVKEAAPSKGKPPAQKREEEELDDEVPY